jgi:hypothetical protein
VASAAYHAVKRRSGASDSALQGTYQFRIERYGGLIEALVRVEIQPTPPSDPVPGIQERSRGLGTN